MNELVRELVACGRGFLSPPEEESREHVRLLLSPEGAPCPPWQSAHEAAGTLFGVSHHRALEWYRRYGFEPRLESEPADHVGLLLTFAAWLVEQGEDPRGYAADHLAWLDGYCARLGEEARTAYWKELAARTRRVVSELVPVSAPV